MGTHVDKQDVGRHLLIVENSHHISHSEIFLRLLREVDGFVTVKMDFSLVSNLVSFTTFSVFSPVVNDQED